VCSAATPFTEWLPTKAARAAKSNTREPIAGIDQKAAQARAVEYLRDAPLAVEGDGGDATAFQVAARVRDFGVDEATCLELMLKDWNPGCSPPWDANELAVKVGNAYAYTKDRPGNAAPEAVFKPIDPFADVHRWDLPQVSRELERIRELSKTDPQRFSEVRGALFGLNVTTASLGWLLAGSVGGWLIVAGGFTGLGAFCAGMAVAGTRRSQSGAVGTGAQGVCIEQPGGKRTIYPHRAVLSRLARLNRWTSGSAGTVERSVSVGRRTDGVARSQVRVPAGQRNAWSRD
jgi:hypothetical protein